MVIKLYISFILKYLYIFSSYVDFKYVKIKGKQNLLISIQEIDFDNANLLIISICPFFCQNFFQWSNLNIFAVVFFPNLYWFFFCRCFGLLLSPGKDVRNSDMHLLDLVRIAFFFLSLYAISSIKIVTPNLMLKHIYEAISKDKGISSLLFTSLTLYLLSLSFLTAIV